MRTILSVLACAFLLPVTSLGDVAYVRAGAQPGGDGLSWATAKPGIRGGINVAVANPEVTEVWVAAGTYRCGGEPFELAQGIPLYGGFNGTEDEWTERDPYLNETILDGQSQSRVLRGGYTWPKGDLIVDGFVITGGREWQGGAYENYQANPIFVNCDFRGNTANNGDGGAIYVYEGEPLFVNCDFRGNFAYRRGGAINWYDCRGTFVNCRFRNNESGGSGGAIEVYTGATRFVNCTFFGNQVGETIFPTNIVSGSAIMDYNGVCQLDNCIVWGNSGGGWIEYPFTEHAYFPSAGIPTYNWSIVKWDFFPGENTVNIHPELIDSAISTVPNVFSPAIDSANHLYLPEDEFDLDRDGNTSELVPLDRAGAPRFVNSSVVADQAPPDPFSPPALDRGAYEFNDDCNGNGVSDLQDVLSGFSSDCDGDTIPDECELDWDGDGVSDNCQIISGDGEDCNDNLLLDAMELARGTSVDRDQNGVIDDCDPDCNANGRPDILDITSGFSRNCNGNEFPDQCEVPTPPEMIYSIGDADAEIYLTDGTGADIIWLEAFRIEPGRESIRGIEFVIGDVDPGRSCSVALWIDFDRDRNPTNAKLVASRSTDIIWDGNNAYARVRLDDTVEFNEGDIVFAGVIYNQRGGEFAVPIDQGGSSNNSWIAYSGAVAEDLSLSGGLGRLSELGFSGRLMIRMIPALSLNNDCNANLRPDDCDIANGAADSDGDGILDLCDFDKCLGDFDGNGAVDGGDLTQLLGYWNEIAPGLDLTGDLIVDGADITVLLSLWGPC